MSQPTITMSSCTKKSLCVDCDSKTCHRAGDIGADCPKYKCDNDIPNDCENCQWIREYVQVMRKEYRKQT